MSEITPLWREAHAACDGDRDAMWDWLAARLSAAEQKAETRAEECLRFMEAAAVEYAKACAAEARVEAAEGVVRMASAYRMIESGELTRALGMGEPLPTEVAAARTKLDDALSEYQASRAALACPPQQQGEK